MIRLMVEKVGGGFVPIIEYTPGDDEQLARAREASRVLRVLYGVRSLIAGGDQ